MLVESWPNGGVQEAVRILYMYVIFPISLYDFVIHVYASPLIWFCICGST